MKIIVGLVVSAFIAVLLQTYLNFHDIDTGVISTLFTVVGVIFSVGMSLIISVSTAGVKNKEARSVFRSQLSKIRTRFIAVFVILSFMFVLLPIKGDSAIWCLFKVKELDIEFNNGVFLISNLLLSIIYYIVNFYSIQTSVYEMEDRIDKGM